MKIIILENLASKYQLIDFRFARDEVVHLKVMMKALVAKYYSFLKKLLLTN